MEINKVLEIQKQIFKEATQIITDKSHDYSSSDDALANLKSCKALGIEPSDGVLIRIMDKLGRFANLRNKKAKVQSEKNRDTIIDAINYLVLLYILEEEKQSRLEKMKNEMSKLWR